MGTTMRHAFAALLAALMACALTACGGDAVALDPVAQAATKTGAAESMRIEMTMTMASPQFGSKPVTFKMSGIAANKRSAMTMRMPAVEGVELGNIEVRADGLVVYMRMPFLQAAAPQLKPWIKVDLGEAGKNLGIDLDALMELSKQSNPTKALDFLRAAGRVKELGDETVRGVKTTRYKGVIDLERYAMELEKNGGGKAAASSFRKVIELSGKTTMPIELWIDDDSLVRRMVWEQTVSAAAGQAPSTVKATMELFDYGADVKVVIPPDGQTSSLQDLQKLGDG
jgi:outer membrane lipoprotein-sorting protein